MPSQRLSTHLSWASGGGWPSGIATTIAPAVMAGFWRHVLTQLPMVELQFFRCGPAKLRPRFFRAGTICALTDPPKPNMKLTVLPLFRECLLPGDGG